MSIEINLLIKRDWYICVYDEYKHDVTLGSGSNTDSCSKVSFKGYRKSTVQCIIESNSALNAVFHGGTKELNTRQYWKSRSDIDGIT